MFVVGQECPKVEVPAPNSKPATQFQKEFLQVCVYVCVGGDGVVHRWMCVYVCVCRGGGGGGAYMRVCNTSFLCRCFSIVCFGRVWRAQGRSRWTWYDELSPSLSSLRV